MQHLGKVAFLEMRSNRNQYTEAACSPAHHFPPFQSGSSRKKTTEMSLKHWKSQLFSQDEIFHTEK